MRASLFVDVRKLGRLVDHPHRELTVDEVTRIARTYNAWRGEPDVVEYRDRPGFCTTATTEEIAAHGYVLTLSRYVGTSDVEDDG